MNPDFETSFNAKLDAMERAAFALGEHEGYYDSDVRDDRTRWEHADLKSNMETAKSALREFVMANVNKTGWVQADFARKMEARLRALLGVIEAHECTCFSCDRDGETYCDCLAKEAKLAKATLT